METCSVCGQKLNIEESDVCFACQELERMASNAISAQRESIKFARELAEEMREEPETVGDWNGLEQAAADAMNRIYDYLAEAVEVATASRGEPIHPDVIRIIFLTAQEQWLELEGRELLFLSKENARIY